MKGWSTNMANKWKYATLDAETRLKMLREGNKEVFDEEVERTKSVTKARRELGLDTKEQENWIDTVGYNYNLYNAKMLGEDTANVSKTGYANLYLNESDEKKQKSSRNYFSGSKTNQYDNAFYKLRSAADAAKKAINSKYDALLKDAESEFEKQYSYLEEALVNNGDSLEGGKATMLLDEFRKEFEVAYGQYDKARKEELQKSEQKYANLTDTLISSKNNGMSGLSLVGAATDMILKNADTDGYDANDIIVKDIGVVSASKEKVESTALPEKNEATSETLTESKDVYKDLSGSVFESILPFTKEKVRSVLEKLGIDKSDIDSLSERLYDYIKAQKNQSR